MPKNDDYWQARMMELEDEQYQKSTEFFEDIMEQFKRAQLNIQADIEKWYYRLADNNEISYAAAKKLLKKSELEEFKWTLEQYIQKGRENAVSGEWIKELENASARYHINYLETLKIQLQQHAELLYAEYESRTTEFLGKVFKEQFYRTAYEIAKGTGVGTNLAVIDTRKIDAVLKRPWAQDGKAFSGRIWQNKERLVNELHRELTQNIIRGESPQKTINNLAKKMNVSKRQAGTLIMTEEAAIASVASKECFKELDVEKYKIIATLDGMTCDICGSMDGKVFKMSEYKSGITAHPFHPNCRCCTAPCFDNWYGLDRKRVARDPVTGKEYKVPADMTYQEWMDKYQNGGILEETTDEWEEEAKKELLMDEKALSARKKETAVVYGPDGEFLFQKRGGESEVLFSWSEIKRLEGNTISHNHPSGASFSARDIATLHDSKAAEIRAATEDGVYFMRAPQSWPKEINNADKIVRVIKDISADVRKKYQILYDTGQVSKVERHQKAIHEINTIFAERYGLDYGKEEY